MCARQTSLVNRLKQLELMDDALTPLRVFDDPVKECISQSATIAAVAVAIETGKVPLDADLDEFGKRHAGQ